MLIVGRNKNLDWAINFAYVLQIYRVGASILVTYHSGEFDDFNGVITDIRTINFACYDDSDTCEYVLSIFYQALDAGKKVFDFNTVDTDVIF